MGAASIRHSLRSLAFEGRGNHDSGADPALGHDGLSFNLSHTKGLVACAITHRAEIGIDVELMEPRRAGLDIAEHFFSAAEIELLRATPSARRMPACFRLTPDDRRAELAGDAVPCGDGPQNGHCAA